MRGLDSVAVGRTTTRSLHGTANPLNSEGILTGGGSAEKMVPNVARSPAIGRRTTDLGYSAPAKAAEPAGRDVSCSSRANKVTGCWELTGLTALPIHMVNAFTQSQLQNHEGLIAQAGAKASHSQNDQRELRHDPPSFLYAIKELQKSI